MNRVVVFQSCGGLVIDNSFEPLEYDCRQAAVPLVHGTQALGTLALGTQALVYARILGAWERDCTQSSVRHSHRARRATLPVARTDNGYDNNKTGKY